MILAAARISPETGLGDRLVTLDLRVAEMVVDGINCPMGKGWDS